MNLYLVQHGEAKPQEEDPERPLTRDGTAQIRRVAAFIRNYSDIHIHTIFHSGKKRAIQTAELFAEKLKPTKGIEQGKELSPNSLPWGWVERLTHIEEDIMLVGHLPHLEKLSALLLCQDENKPIISFKNGGVLAFSRNESGIWSLVWVIIPKILPLSL